MGSPSLATSVHFGAAAAFPIVQRQLPRGSESLARAARIQTNTYELKVTQREDERVAAFKLVHDAYVRAGLMPLHPMGMRVMKHHLSDHTDVLVIKRQGAVVFTSTLVRDGEYGLPLESLFGAEVQALRDEGLRVAEVSCLASDISLQDQTQRFELFVALIGLVFQTARYHQIDRLLLAVHPRHAKVHQRMFGCTLCSEVKEYAAVEGNPAVLCSHDFAQLDQTRYCLYDQVYRVNYSESQLRGERMKAAEKQRLAQAVSAQVSSMVPMAA